MRIKSWVSTSSLQLSALAGFSCADSPAGLAWCTWSASFNSHRERVNMTKFQNRALVASVLASAASLSQAAVDVTEITAAGTDIAAVGAAVFAVAVGIKLFKWIRRAL